MVNSICREIELQGEFLSSKSLNSIYFGGGTPSLLTKSELEQIFQVIRSHYSLNSVIEVTLEANPDDLTEEKLEELAASPVNRLSVGIQSFRNEDLKLMNRSHDAEQAEACVKMAQNYDFENISLDLIYGIPGMNDEDWKLQLEKAIELNVPHISSYALTVEEKTVLHYKISRGEIPPIDEEVAARQFHILWDTLLQAGYEHYEVSNFAKPGCRAKHNSSYWSGEPYLGLGPSAHSFKDDKRQWNISNNARYISSIERGEVPFQEEKLSVKDRFNETIMTSLRQEEGLDMNKLQKEFGLGKFNYLEKESEALLREGKLIKKDSSLYIPQKWRFHSDGIASDLFFI